MPELTRRDMLRGVGAVVGALATYSLASTVFQPIAGAAALTTTTPVWNDDPTSPSDPPSGAPSDSRSAHRA
jgi:hypothetical protein